MRVGLRLLRQWWHDEVDYRWVVTAIASRSALGVLKTAIGLCGLAAPLIAVLTLFSSTGPDGTAARAVMWSLVVLGAVWSARWLAGPWPGETESLVLIAVADVCVTAVCVLNPGYAVPSVGMMMLLITGVYLSAFHGPKTLVVHTVWALFSAMLLSVPLFRGGDLAAAVIMLVGMTAAVIVPPGLQFCYGVLRSEMLSDPLTTLLSRRGLEYHSAIWFARPASAPACVMVIDLDRFKAVNDTFGHCSGDEVLVRTAARLRRVSPAGSIVSRCGGEEFVVIVRLPLGAAAIVADRLRCAVAEPVGAISVTASIGLAAVDVRVAGTCGHQLVREIIGSADGAMYRAKQRGGNTVVISDSGAATDIELVPGHT
ncbi:diguanylate cyclase [Nocardia sp. ET3-3]|uniref:Diguanylate cyclase n=1 Tax=Nocardia terrae TaxID=2675851 RepID=A0A7K1UTG7_9NOCA|nr:GGDEF domain-containing protein [Nocardia terrae]MVU77571.1 diguanylate cyclase [Nocardia terrae]